MRSRPTLALVIAAVVPGVVPPRVCAQDAADAAASLSRFGLEVFGSVARGSSGPNVVFSPLGAGFAVALLGEGAEGETAAEVRAALGVDADGWRGLGTGIRALLSTLEEDTAVVSRIGTSLWVDEGRRLDGDFRARAERVHRAVVASLDLQSAASAERINAWASERTAGRIPRVVSAPIRGDMALLLLNAVYFKGLWAEPFDTVATEARSFALAGGDSVAVPTMHRIGDYRHFEDGEASGVRLPYRGDRFAAWVILPARASSVGALERTPTPERLRAWAEAARTRRVSVFVPRFTHRGSWDLLGPLRAAGVRRALSADSAQIGGLWDPRNRFPDTFVDEASQATFIQLDEEATEAAAVTAIGIVVTSAPPPPVEFRVDRPFLVVLRDDRTGAVLFVARIGDPTDEGGG